MTRTVVVTGATSGIGRAAAREFAARGDRLVLAARAPATLAQVRAECLAAGGRALAGLVRALQQEGRDAPGVHVCLVSQGSVDTPVYRQAANYLGRIGRPPPPVGGPERVARAIVACADRPRREVSVGRANLVLRFGFTVLPGVYDVLVGPLMRLAGLSRRRVGRHDGVVFAPNPAGEAVRGGRNRSPPIRLRDGRSATTHGERRVTIRVNRRAALGIGTVATAGTVLGAAAPASAAGRPRVATTPARAAAQVAASYARQTARAGGNWQAYVSVADGTAAPLVAVADEADRRIEAYSVNKIAVAVAVLDKVDRGLLTLAQRVDVTASIVIPGGDGIFSLDGAYPSSVTLGHALAALLTVSDDTAVRLCGLVCPAAELNQILVAKGFPNTQVQPVANPNRFYLGTSTPRETHDLLRALVSGTLLSASSTAFLLGLLRSPIAFTDGVRREMSSAERARVATKAGWFDTARHEAGIVFDAAGAPVLTYALFADGQAGADDFGATHPAVQARARMGRVFLTAVAGLAGAGPTHRAAAWQPSNGG